MAISNDNEMFAFLALILGGSWITDGLLQADEEKLRSVEGISQSHLENILMTQQRLGELLLGIDDDPDAAKLAVGYIAKLFAEWGGILMALREEAQSLREPKGQSLPAKTKVADTVGA